MKIGITADCSSGVEYAKFKHNIKITRTTINFPNKIYVDGIDITADEFYELLSKSECVPSTSAPTPGEIASRIEEWKNDGCTDVIHFPISFGLSDYGLNLEKYSEGLVEGVKVHIFNPRTACLMQGYNAHYAEKLVAKGYTVEEIFTECGKVRDQTTAYFVVDDIKYLVKNGRLSGAAGFIGGLAKIKPILHLNQTGKIVACEKVRTHPKAVARCVDLAIDYGKKYDKALYLIAHTGRYKEAEMLQRELESRVSNAARFEIMTITPTVGAHIGCGILGFGILGLDNLKEEFLD